MPSNPLKEDKLAYQYINDKLTNIPPIGILKRNLERNTLLRYAISTKKINDFIKEYYIETGLIIITEDGILKENKIIIEGEKE